MVLARLMASIAKGGADGPKQQREDSMSLSMPALPAIGGEQAPTGDDDFVCDTSDTLIAAIEKCLDNGLGTCLVVEGEKRYVGRISLEDIGKAVLDGALLAPTLGQYLEKFTHRRPNAAGEDADVLRPVLDAAGNLIGITIDRSAPPARTPTSCARSSMRRATSSGSRLTAQPSASRSPART
jgi:hypothetical protein